MMKKKKKRCKKKKNEGESDEQVKNSLNVASFGFFQNFYFCMLAQCVLSFLSLILLVDAFLLIHKCVLSSFFLSFFLSGAFFSLFVFLLGF